jgi:tetratricopeptide (TPR) repeat protein
MDRLNRSAFIAFMLILWGGSARAEVEAEDESEPPGEADEEDEVAESDEVDESGDTEAGDTESGDREPPEPAAETPEPEEAPNMRRAREHFEEGLRLAEREFWGPAAAEFEVSLRLHPTAPALLNQAICYQELFRYTQALSAFERYLSDYGEGLSEARRARVQERIREIRSMLGQVEVFVTVGGATVIVDGERVGTSPLPSPLMLPSGQHRIEAQLDGYQTAQATVWASPREPQTIQLELTRVPQQGLLRVTTNTPGAMIAIDDHEVEGPIFEGLVSEGQHRIVVTAEGYEDAVELVDIAAGGQQALTLDALPTRRVHRAWFWSMIGLTIAGSLATIGLGATAVALDADYDVMALDAQDQYDRGHAFMRATDATLGISTGFAIAALVLGFYTDWDGD